MPTLHATPPEELTSLTADYLQTAEQVQPEDYHNSTVEISSRRLRAGHAAARIGRAIGISMLAAGIYGAHSAHDALNHDRTTAIERLQALDLRAVDTQLNTSLSTGHMPDAAPLTAAVKQATPGITADVQTAQKDANQLVGNLEVAGLGLIVGGLSGSAAFGLGRRRLTKNTRYLQANGMTTTDQLFSKASPAITVRTGSSDDSPRLHLKQRQPTGEHHVPKAAEFYLRVGLLGAAAVMLFGSPASEAAAEQVDSAIGTVMPTDYLANAIAEEPHVRREADRYATDTSRQVADTIVAKLPKTEATLAHDPQIQQRANQALQQQIAAKLKANSLQHGAESDPIYFENTYDTAAPLYQDLFRGGEVPKLFAGLGMAWVMLASALRHPRGLGSGVASVSKKFLNENLRGMKIK